VAWSLKCLIFLEPAVRGGPMRHSPGAPKR